MTTRQERKEDEFVTRVGPIEIDWPRSIGYFGGVGLAVAFDVIAPPLALFIAAVPLLKLLQRPEANVVERVLGAIVEGVAKPVGGDSELTVRLADSRQRFDDKETIRRSRPLAATTDDGAPAPGSATGARIVGDVVGVIA